MALCNLHFSCSGASWAPLRGSCPRSAVMPHGAASRAGTLESHRPSWLSLGTASVFCFRSAPGPEDRKARVHLPPSQAPPHPALPCGEGRKPQRLSASRLRLPPNQSRTRPEVAGSGPLSARAGSPPATAGTGVQAAAWPSPPRAAHKHSLGPQGRKGIFQPASGLDPPPPARNRARGSLDPSQRPCPAQPGGCVRGPGPGC